MREDITAARLTEVLCVWCTSTYFPSSSILNTMNLYVREFLRSVNSSLHLSVGTTPDMVTDTGCAVTGAA